MKKYDTLVILTCYATSIVVIYLKLNLPTSMHLFTFDTNGGYLLTGHVSGSHMVFFRPSKVNSYKTTLHNLNLVTKWVKSTVIVYSPFSNNLNYLHHMAYFGFTLHCIWGN